MILKESTKDFINDMNDLVSGATIVHHLETIKNASKYLINQLDRDGESPLHYAAVNDDLEMCKLLLDKSPELLTIKCDEGKLL